MEEVRSNVADLAKHRALVSIDSPAADPQSQAKQYNSFRIICCRRVLNDRYRH